MAIIDENTIVNEDLAKTLGGLATAIATNSNPLFERSDQFGEEKLISILNVIGTIGKRPTFTRIQLNKIEEDVMTCKSSKELEERIKGIVGSLEVSTEITLSKVIQFILSLSNDLAISNGLLTSLRTGQLKEFKESLLYLFLNSLVINVLDEKYCRKVSSTSNYLVDYAARKGDILFSVPNECIAPVDSKCLGQDYNDGATGEIYLKAGLDDNSRLKYNHQKRKVDYLKSIYNFFYYLSPDNVTFTHLSTWRTYFYEYEVYNANIIQKGIPKTVRFILRFSINDSNSLYQSLVEQRRGNVPNFIKREVTESQYGSGALEYGTMKIIGTGDQETILRFPESPFVADISMQFNTEEQTLMTSFKIGLKKVSDLQFEYIGGNAVSNYKSKKLIQILNDTYKGTSPGITVDKNFVEFIHQVIKREINHESLSQIIDKFCKEEELTYAFYNR